MAVLAKLSFLSESKYYWIFTFKYTHKVNNHFFPYVEFFCLLGGIKHFLLLNLWMCPRQSLVIPRKFIHQAAQIQAFTMTEK